MASEASASQLASGVGAAAAAAVTAGNYYVIGKDDWSSMKTIAWRRAAVVLQVHITYDRLELIGEQYTYVAYLCIQYTN